MPIVQSIKVYRGEDITLHFTMTPGVDITGWVIGLTITRGYNLASPKIIALTAVITSGPNGQFDFIMPKAILDITPDKYVYDVFRTNPGNNRILSIGDFIISPDAKNPV